MYITLQSIKRNLGLFNLEIEDLIIGSIFGLIFIVLFLLHFYTTSLVVISLGILSLGIGKKLRKKLIKRSASGYTGEFSGTENNNGSA